MSNQAYAFRTAIGGFHRGDVSSYIAQTAALHEAQLDALKKQLALLERENEALRAQLSQVPEPAVPVQEEPAPAEAPIHERELAAYRRAEAAERVATQRARKLYDDVQSICDSSLHALEDSNDVAQAAASNISIQLEIIRTSVEGVYESLRASSEKLKVLGQMVPDPAEGLEED